MEFQLSYFNRKRWCCESAALILSAIWKTQQWLQEWKRSVFIPIPKKSNAKECSNYSTISLISHASKFMLKILQVQFQQYVTCEIPDVPTGFWRDRGTRDQIASIHWIMEKAIELQKNNYLCFLNYAKAFDWVDHNKLSKILKENLNLRIINLRIHS